MPALMRSGNHGGKRATSAGRGQPRGVAPTDGWGPVGIDQICVNRRNLWTKDSCQSPASLPALCDSVVEESGFPPPVAGPSGLFSGVTILRGNDMFMIDDLGRMPAAGGSHQRSSPFICGFIVSVVSPRLRGGRLCAPWFKNIPVAGGGRMIIRPYVSVVWRLGLRSSSRRPQRRCASGDVRREP